MKIHDIKVNPGRRALGLFVYRKTESVVLISFARRKIFDERERKFADFDAAMIFADRARDIGRRTTGHETIRGESFLGFGDVRWLDVAVA